MIKNIICLLCLLCVAIQAELSADVNSSLMSVDCAQALQPHLKKILQINEAKELINKIQKDGPIKIRVDNHPVSQQFGAYWDPDQRTICVCISTKQAEGEVIGSIIFELHNAAANTKLDYIDHLATNRVINKESYVKAIEFVEYENSIAASKIARKGISMGLFPKEAHLPTYKNFDEHYRYQRIGGHSAQIERNYNQLFS